jgi:hypothetical protein
VHAVNIKEIIVMKVIVFIFSMLCLEIFHTENSIVLL